MNNKQTFYFLPVALITVLGFFASLAHYHSDGLECLDHAEESHIVQTESFCPVSTLVSDNDFTIPFTFEVILPSEDQPIQYKSEDKYNTYIASKSGRSPPFLA